jgi:hypothetical protein
MKNYTFVKNVKGGLTITLDSWNMQLPTRNFNLIGNVRQIAVPEDYALGLFVTDGALSMMKSGYFTIANFAELQKKAREIGLFADDEVETCYSIEEIEKILVKQNSKKVEEIIARNKRVEIDNLITLAREHIEELPSNIVRQIEDACGAELRIE